MIPSLFAGEFCDVLILLCSSGTFSKVSLHTRDRLGGKRRVLGAGSLGRATSQEGRPVQAVGLQGTRTLEPDMVLGVPEPWQKQGASHRT